MKYLLLSLCLLALISCSTWESITGKQETADTEVRQAPTDLEGPAYDPGESPAVMTSTTPLPGEEAAPAAYGTPDGVSAPVAYGSTPAAYGNSNLEAKGAEAVALSPAEAAIAPVLDGDWYNTDDDREVVRFTPTHYTTFYDGELVVEEPMHYHANCPGDCNGGQPAEFACFTIDGPGGATCYGVIRLTDQVMELSMLGVSTETIIYQKIQ